MSVSDPEQYWRPNININESVDSAHDNKKNLMRPMYDLFWPVTSKQAIESKTMSLNNKRKASSGLIVICANVTEHYDTLLQARHKRELEEWFKLCAKMKLETIEPVSSTRLSRPPNSPDTEIVGTLVSCNTVVDIDSFYGILVSTISN
ncbi:hypothetical protein X801_02783 [Opisthorchis viverrini]|uniref:Uncharacterized protein n=1 Tax=Opisthorchis viverrini TaxID=6198 RepID=A0A1S8X3N9_OPIVI|nr:hypothetical protein X801_02783 [Opisthorchis viverrini]